MSWKDRVNDKKVNEENSMIKKDEHRSREKVRRSTLYPTAAPVGYKITLFTEKYKSFFEKSSPVRLKIAILAQRTNLEEMLRAK